MITRFQYKSNSSLHNLLDILVGTTLWIATQSGMRPDYRTHREMRKALKKVLRKNLMASERLESAERFQNSGVSETRSFTKMKCIKMKSLRRITIT